MIPTPASLATSVRDLAIGYDTELTGSMRPDPAIGHYLTRMARCVGERLPADDERLAAFAPFTDSTGYVWLDTNQLGPFFQAAAGGHWSFERWFAGLVAVLGAVVQPLPGDLEERAAVAAQLDGMARSGFRPVSVDVGGMILRRRP